MERIGCGGWFVELTLASTSRGLTPLERVQEASIERMGDGWMEKKGQMMDQKKEGRKGEGLQKWWWEETASLLLPIEKAKVVWCRKSCCRRRREELQVSGSTATLQKATCTPACSGLNCIQLPAN